MRKSIHKVEDQWHYSTMTEYGWKSSTPTDVGLVRSYSYSHPEVANHIVITTGCNGDYWRDKTSGAGGYWSSLEEHLQSLTS